MQTSRFAYLTNHGVCDIFYAIGNKCFNTVTHVSFTKFETIPFCVAAVERNEKMETLIKTGKMTILPKYGRVLKLEPIPGVNVLWENPANWLTSYGWINPGGDRVWIAPENELFAASATDCSYAVPQGIDPGRWSVVSETADKIEMVNDVTLDFVMRGKKMDLKMTRTITELESDAPAGVAFAGYEQKLQLDAVGTFPSDLRPDLWSVLQLPPGGRILFPAENPVLYMGVMPADKGVDGIYSFPVPAKDEHFKVGVTPSECRGIMAYINTECEKPFLVIRTFKSYKDGRYVDAPTGAPDKPCSQQFYFDEGVLGGFGEMEYHSQYITPEKPSITDTSILQAYVGTEEQLNAIVREKFSAVL